MTNENPTGVVTPTPTVTEATPTASVTPTNESLVDKYIQAGESRYASVEALVDGKVHADSHIKSLNDQLLQERAARTALEEELAKRAKVEELINTQRTSTVNPDTTGFNTQTSPETQTIDSQAIVQQVLQTINQGKERELGTANVSSFEQTLKNRYADNYQNVLESKAKEIGLTTKEVLAISAKTPGGALQMLGVDTTPATRAMPSTGSVSTGMPSQGSYVDPAVAVIDSKIAAIRESKGTATSMKYRASSPELTKLEMERALLLAGVK